jgi:hypothetical protein
VAVRDVLSHARLEAARAGCDAVVRGMLAHDTTVMKGGRGSQRYSFGAAPAALGQTAAWGVLADPPALLACLTAIFRSPDWWCPKGAAALSFHK